MTKTMSYEATPFKVGSAKAIKNKATNEALNEVSTMGLVWHIIKRHKFGLVLTWALVMTISYIFPPVWDILGSLI